MLHPQLNHQISSPAKHISWNDSLGAWEVRSYAEVLAILKDNRFSAAGVNIKDQNINLPDIDSNPREDQAEVIQALQQELPWIREKMQQIVLTTCLNRSYSNIIDFYDELILPCCQQLALELTDSTIRDEEKEELLEHAQSVFLMNSSENPDKALEATTSLSTYFLDKIVHARSSPKADYISVLAQTKAAPTILLSPIIQLFTGVATSLPLLLSNVLLALLTHPEEKEKYIKNPSQSINELLRYAGPSQLVYRIALQDVEVGTMAFKKGERLALCLANANLDATQFVCPHQLNSDRNAATHLSLGKGLHACLGAPIIRAALTIIPATILNHFPEIKIATDKVVWGGSSTIRGVISLPKN